MSFTHPVFFYIALALIPLLTLAGLYSLWRRRRDLNALASRLFIDRLTAHLSSGRRLLKGMSFLAGLFLLCLALAGPQWGSRMVEVRRQGVDVMIALDVSRSMLAEDIKPSRLRRAQQELGALIDQLNGDRIGVIAFAGSAQIACPLTTDYDAAKMFLNYLTPDSVAIPGTSLGEAIRTATSAFPKGGEGFRVLVLLTDGEDHHSDPLEAARAAKAAGIRILSIGFGTASGEPIPVREAAGQVTGYLKDSAGRTVVSRLGESTLKQITEITQGAYWPSATGSLEAERLAELINRMQKRDISLSQYGAYEDRFQFMLLPALLLLFFSFWLPARKHSWLLLLLFLLLPAAAARADVGSDVNQGNREYLKQHYDPALQKYQDAQIKNPESPVVQYDLGNALYKLGKFDGAEQAFRQALKTKSPDLRQRAWYNLGNTFFQQKKYPESLGPYGQALKLKPGDAEALNNLALALRFLKQPPKEKPQKGGQQKQEPKTGKDQKPSSGKAQAGDQKQAGPDDKGEQKSGSSAKQETPQDQAKARRIPKPGEMSPEDAANLLDAVREAEQEAQRQRLSGTQDKDKNGRRNVPEDW